MYLLQAFVVHVAFRRHESWAWHAVLWGNLVWFFVDSAVSLVRGATFNVWMINLTPLVLVLIPLVATREQAKRGKAAELL